MVSNMNDPIYIVLNFDDTVTPEQREVFIKILTEVVQEQGGELKLIDDVSVKGERWDITKSAHN